MKWTRWMGCLLLGIGLIGDRAIALPGQTPEEAEIWLRSNQTLQPTSDERLLIRRSDTPAQRFTFQATPLQVGRASVGSTRVIRTEEFALFDMINGVTRDRLEESLRRIYGASVYQDYVQARVVYAYPETARVGRAVNRETPLLAALQGEVRDGDRYAYWLEVARRPDGFSYTGRLTVFLRSDLPKLTAELQNR